MFSTVLESHMDLAQKNKDEVVLNFSFEDSHSAVMDIRRSLFRPPPSRYDLSRRRTRPGMYIQREVQGDDMDVSRR